MTSTELKPSEPLRWQVHLLRRSPEKALVIVACIILAAAMGLVALGHWLVGLVGAWLVFSATAEFFVPISYEITPLGAQSRCLWQWQQVKWENVKRVLVDQSGVKLSPLPTPSRLDAYRGVYLRFNDNREQVLNAIEQWRKQENQDVGRTSERGTEERDH